MSGCELKSRLTAVFLNQDLAELFRAVMDDEPAALDKHTVLPLKEVMTYTDSLGECDVPR